MPRIKKEEATKEIKEPVKRTTKKASSTKGATKKASTTKKSSTVKKEAKKTTTKKTTTKKASTTKKAATAKATAKKEPKKTVATKKVSTAKKASTKETKKTSTTKKATTAKKTTTKKTTTKKASTAKKTTKASTTTKRKSSSSKKAVVQVLEYYDLPYRYNQTIVKLLYQTPNILFIYWDISDADRSNFVKQYGDNFFNDTVPVLVIHNETLNYSFEVEIDDFANSWYLHVNDSNCKYKVELGRRPKQFASSPINIENNYLYVSDSNEMDSPNDHILFDRNLETVYFKDVKTNIITSQNITSLTFMRNIGKLYSLYDLFSKDRLLDRSKWELDLLNPSSN